MLSKNLKLDVYVKDKNVKWLVIESIKKYRAACRKAYSVCAMAEMAGASFEIDDKDYNFKVLIEQEECLKMRLAFLGRNPISTSFENGFENFIPHGFQSFPNLFIATSFLPDGQRKTHYLKKLLEDTSLSIVEGLLLTSERLGYP
jgi:hypothetical protein